MGMGKLRRQISAEPSDVSLDMRARVVSYQAHDPGIDTFAAEVTRSIQGVETGLCQFRGVADVMQPGRRHKIIRQRQLFGHPPSATSHRPDMPPATRQFFRQHRPGKLSRLIDIHHNPTVPGVIHSPLQPEPGDRRIRQGDRGKKEDDERLRSTPQRGRGRPRAGSPQNHLANRRQ
jgi:hypothetical protein